MPRGIYDRSKAKRRTGSDKPQANGGAKKAAKKAPAKQIDLGRRRPTRAGVLSPPEVVRKAAEADKAFVKDVLEHLPGELVDAEVRRPREVTVSDEVHGWLAVQSKARGVSPGVLVEELVFRHIQLGLS